MKYIYIYIYIYIDNKLSILLFRAGSFIVFSVYFPCRDDEVFPLKAGYCSIRLPRRKRRQFQFTFCLNRAYDRCIKFAAGISAADIIQLNSYTQGHFMSSTSFVSRRARTHKLLIFFFLPSYF